MACLLRGTLGGGFWSSSASLSRGTAVGPEEGPGLGQGCPQRRVGRLARELFPVPRGRESSLCTASLRVWLRGDRAVGVVQSVL